MEFLKINLKEMNYATKRTIAREILIFFLTILIVGVIYSFFWVKSQQIKKKEIRLEKQIAQHNIELENQITNYLSFDPKIVQALKDFVATSNSGKYKDENELMSYFPELKGHEIKVLRDFVATANRGKYETEIELLSKFPEFDTTYQRIQSEKIKVSRQLEILKNDSFNIDLSAFIKWISIIGFCVSYLFRYIYYSIKWAILTLKTKDINK